jgi:hypothetical protein
MMFISEETRTTLKTLYLESISMSSHVDIFYNINNLISYNNDSILHPHRAVSEFLEAMCKY